MKHKFLILIIAVCILEVNSWPQRGGHWRGRGNRDPEGDEQDGSEEENERRSNNRHRPGLLSSFLDTNPLPHFQQAFREGLTIPGRVLDINNQLIREGLTIPGRVVDINHQIVSEGLTIPGRVIGMNGLFGGRGGGGRPDRPNRPHNHPKTESNSEKTSSTTPSTTTSTSSTTPSTTTSTASTKPSSTTSSTTKQLETNPPEFTFKLPTDDKFDLDNKGPTTEKAGNGTDNLNNRRLINAPDRCQDDAVGNCREVF